MFIYYFQKNPVQNTHIFLFFHYIVEPSTTAAARAADNNSAEKNLRGF